MKFLFIQKWHKKIGVYTALFVIFLAISGIALNHTEKLKLNTTYIKMDWLLDLYQISPASEPIGYLSSNNWVIQVGERVYFNNKEIINDANKLIGVVNVNDIYVIAYDGKLVLLTNDAEILESLGSAEGVPSGMKAIGYDNQNIIIQSAHGYYRVNLDILNWNEHDLLSANWSDTSNNISEKLRIAIFNEYRGKGLTIERVLRDMHSGRVVGKWGTYFMDLVAVLMLVISATGIWMWLKRR